MCAEDRATRQRLRYDVDLVFCIDGTGSMGSIIDRVKDGAMNFEHDLRAALDEKDKEIDTLRVKVIVFRDLWVDVNAIQVSDFFTLPQDTDAYAAFVRGIEADGGGDEPESGLEALALAIKSEWTTAGDKRRHVVVVWTDASPHPLEKAGAERPPGYPDGMPANFDELTDMWEGAGQSSSLHATSKRLVVFAPDAQGWTDIGNHWNQALHYTVLPGLGLAEVNYAWIFDLLAESMRAGI